MTEPHMFTVHTGPPPERKTRGKYPFAKMAVGAWFVAPRDMGVHKDSADGRQKTITGAANAWTKNNNPGAAFEVYLTDDGDVCCRRTR